MGLRALPAVRGRGRGRLEPRSRRPRASPRRTSGTFEDEIVELRKELADLGFDAGAHTIGSTWRVGTVRPRSSPRSRRSGGSCPGGGSSPRATEAAAELVRAVRSRDAERTLAGRHHPRAPRRRARGRDLERDRRSLAVVGRIRCPGDLQGRRRRRELPPSRCGLWVLRLAAHRQRGGVHRGAAWGAVRDRARVREARDPRRPLAPLPPADLRQGRTVPPDAEAVPRQAGPGDLDRDAAGPARPVPRLLQHRQAPPGDRATHAGRGVRRPTQSDAVARELSRCRVGSGCAATRSISPGS